MNTLDSMVDALAKDPARKFVVVEQVLPGHVLTFFSLKPLAIDLLLPRIV